jgi:hypothetical protein
MLPAGHSNPLDFYGDYISNGVLNDEKGKVISDNVTRELLNAYKNNPGATFTNIQNGGNRRAAVYARIFQDTINFETEGGGTSKLFTFLCYHVVFRTSGLPAGIPSWQNILLGMFIDLADWHQLDHYTAVTVVLDDTGHVESKPAAVMLQQHNNLRTYINGEGITIPEDGRVVVDVAIRSNELYPHNPGRSVHRAVSMPDPKGLFFLLTGRNKPSFAGYDITESEKEAEYVLEFLPPDDAFYTFKGFLGKRRYLRGRDGPPGAEYNTIPELKPINMQLFSGYWRENHQGDIRRFTETVLKVNDYKGFARLQGAEFHKSLQGVRSTTQQGG